MMKSLVFLSVCTLYLAVMTAARDQDESNCHAFCAFGLKVPGCFCSKVASVSYMDSDPVYGKLVWTTTKPAYTTDICDYLCFIQMGGDACQCSKPGVPGRR